LSWTGDYDGARVAAEERRRLAQERGDLRSVIGSIDTLAGVAEHTGDLETAERLFEQAVELGLDTGSPHELANLSGFLVRRGDLMRAKALSEELLRRARAKGDANLEAHALGDLSAIVLLEGRFEEALPLLRADVRRWHELGDLRVLTYGLSAAGFAYGGLGDPESAATIVAAADAIAERIGIPRPEVIRVEAYERAIAKLDPDTLEQARRRGAAMTVDEAVDFVLSRKR
jgi:tetratricopeptide (TPR) repeat protein